VRAGSGPGQKPAATVCSSTTPTLSSYASTSATAPGRPAAGRGATRPGSTTAPGWAGSSPPPPLLAQAGRSLSRARCRAPRARGVRGAPGQLCACPPSRVGGLVPLASGCYPGCRVWIAGSAVTAGPAGLYRTAPRPVALPGLLAGVLDRRSASPPGARRQPVAGEVLWGVLPGQHCRVWIAGSAVTAGPAGLQRRTARPPALWHCPGCSRQVVAIAPNRSLMSKQLRNCCAWCKAVRPKHLARFKFQF
jgi:hypothetical protein